MGMIVHCSLDVWLQPRTVPKDRLIEILVHLTT